MTKIGDEVFRPIIRALDDAPVHMRSLRDVVDGMKAKQIRNRDGVSDVDKFKDKPGPVQEFDTGSFKDLKKRETVGDNLQHDHIPSSAALIRARENELGRKLDDSERRAIHNAAAAVELSDLLHSLSRTFKGRNTQTQIDLDASDLAGAMERDLWTLRTNLQNDGRLDGGQIDSLLQAIRDLNRSRGIE